VKVGVTLFAVLTGKPETYQSCHAHRETSDGFLDATPLRHTNSDGCRFAEVIESEATLVAEACNHPNLLVLSFRLNLIRSAA
jgi:hypothetical protein